MNEYLAIYANTYSAVSKGCVVLNLQVVFLEIMKPWAHLPFSPSGLAEAGVTLISPDSRRWEAAACFATLITPVLSNCYIHAPTGNSTWRGNCRYKPCRNEGKCRGCWVWWMMDRRLISIWDDWVPKKNVSHVFRECLFVWPDWGRCDHKMWGFKYTPTRAKAGAHPATRTDKNVWKCLFGCQLVEILLPRVNHCWHEMWETLKNVQSRGVCY